jgi:hypothetical protein
MQPLHENFVTQIKPKPHPLKAQLKEMGITIGAAARFAELSYPYVLSMLSGSHRMTGRTERKIQELISIVMASTR